MTLDALGSAEHGQPRHIDWSGRVSAIRQLNDALRQHGCGGHVVVTSGIMALPAAVRAGIVRAVRLFDAFGPDNGPHGERDCATMTVEGEGLLWKINYYDRAMGGHSPDPADPAVTARVLTIMLAEEY